MAKIHILPVTVQNKIAAGEVIERPASVVKELAENSVDAGATHVAVELEDGGHRLIRVSDDGHGMDEDDLIASMQRHATSKIRDVDDIFRIRTFGFRGEALPSIGSVSRMAIATCLPGAATGHELLVEGGRAVRVSPAAPRKGTRIEVRDIFFNTPARRKFLKIPSSENTRTAEVLTRLALGNHAVGFRLQAGDRMTMALQPAASQFERVRDLFGDRTADRLVRFDRDIAPGLSVSGWFARPPESRRNSKDIYILVNNRWIRYYGLARAIADAFQGVLPPRSFPFAVINLMVDPAQVDINAHPAKEEVRFEQEAVLISGVRRAVRDALSEVASLPTVMNVSGNSAAPAASGNATSIRPGGPSPAGPGYGEPVPQKALPLPSHLSGGRSGTWADVDLAAAREKIRGAGKGDGPAPADSKVEITNQTGGGTRFPAAAKSGGTDTPVSGPGADSGAALRVGPTGLHRILGQAGGKYILVDGPDGLLLVDPHALHERWNFDRLAEERRRGGSARTLLIPLEMILSPSEASAAEEAVPALAEFGFEFTIRPPNRMRVTAAPAFVPPAKLEVLLRQVLADVGDAGETLQAARDRLLASLACRSSVLLGRTLPDEEMVRLLDMFFSRGQMPTCPHGRPTAIRIGWDELSRRFGR
ncbi:MAG: DNA mismatch repair endonuclease MutL [Planctomycetaceae bacterium]|nr:DNA mismatch repair endonuclease MutL [Planctomycetaceae bacterium]